MATPPLEPYPSDFYVADGRAMVSLGPLSPKRFCTYACQHCYVHAHFTKYPRMEVLQIIEYLRDRRKNFDIVYVSGDTDSFSKPRTREGLALLAAMVELDCDVLFTTRAPLDDFAIEEIAKVCRALRSRGKLLFGCVSINRLRSASHVEPKPIPSPETRMDVLRRLHDSGLVAVLAIRPFLPNVPAQECMEIVSRCIGFCDVVLGEVWYCDTDGRLEDFVLGKGVRLTDDFAEKRMDFDNNGRMWRVYLGTETERLLRQHCNAAGVPFFMRSSPAVEHVRKLRNRWLQGTK